LVETVVKAPKWPGARVRALIVGAALAVLGTVLPYRAGVASADPNPLVRMPALAASAPPAGARDEGAAPGSAPDSLEVILAPSNPAGLQATIRSRYDPTSPDYHHWLTPAEFAGRFGPAPDTVTLATSWLRSRGLAPVRTSTFALSARADASVVARAMGTTFHRYLTRDRAAGLVAQGAPLVPARLQDQIVAIQGLNTLPAFQPTARVARPAAHPAARVSGPAAGAASAGSTSPACSAATTTASDYGAWTMDQLSSIYGVSSLVGAGLNGAGQTVGVYELAQYSKSDVSTYESCFHLANQVSRVNVDGGASYDPSGGTAEADLDIQQIATQAPGASIISYEAPNSSGGAYDLWARIVSADQAKVVSTSWTLCEPDANQAGEVPGGFDALFQEAAADGQTILAASGDSGSEACAQGDYPNPGWDSLAVDYPASDANVTAVGGTDYFGAGDETVWNDCYGLTRSQAASCAANEGYQAGAGGGESAYVPRPAWQWPDVLDWSPSAQQPCGTACREVPDISANAGIPMVDYSASGGGWGAGFGTSYAAPFLAGLVADRNEGCAAPTGNLAPYLYALAKTSAGYAAGFSDTQVGGNDMLDAHQGKYAAGPGYDLATGLGTPSATGLACPEVLSLSPSGGSAGATVTVTGLGLESATFYVGSTAVAAQNVTATSATLVMPAGSGSAVVRAVAGQAVGTLTATFTYPGATPSPPTSSTTTAAAATPPACASAAGRSLPGAAGIAAVSIGGCDGYFVVSPAGQVAAFGSAASHGDLSGHALAAPIIAIEATPDGLGYWLLGADGGVFTFGDARFYGSTGGIHLDAPVVGMAVTPDNRGYWVVAKDGGVFSFGDARFYGSTGGIRLDAPVDGIAVAPGGHGYWLVAGDGGVFTFTSDGFYGSLGGIRLDKPIVGMSSTPDGRGYTLVGSDGGVFTFGDAPFYGSLGAHPPATPVVDLSPAPANNGYYLVAAGGTVYAFGPGSRYFGGV
jgi:hypothetical protein